MPPPFQTKMHTILNYMWSGSLALVPGPLSLVCSLWFAVLATRLSSMLPVLAFAVPLDLWQCGWHGAGTNLSVVPVVFDGGLF